MIYWKLFYTIYHKIIFKILFYKRFIYFWRAQAAEIKKFVQLINRRYNMR
jgi:hypothetical protein